MRGASSDGEEGREGEGRGDGRLGKDRRDE